MESAAPGGEGGADGTTEAGASAVATVWRLSDEQWAAIEPVLSELDPPARKGPARVPARPILDAVIYRGRTGCQWNRLPSEYPDGSTVHRHFQRRVRRGVSTRPWAVLLERCEDLGGVD